MNNSTLHSLNDQSRDVGANWPRANLKTVTQNWDARDVRVGHVASCNCRLHLHGGSFAVLLGLLFLNSRGQLSLELEAAATVTVP